MNANNTAAIYVPRSADLSDGQVADRSNPR
ncbi:uncharacterized protein METZ01_LOCUS251127 [marine metagenome]|uniref:Uncharacterized protein n=1 Tax=marine metagenome TaxID=408172 RepID=A0A382IHA5_9ZZZZ